MSTPADFREDEPARYVEPWYDREDELDDEELLSLDDEDDDRLDDEDDERRAVVERERERFAAPTSVLEPAEDLDDLAEWAEDPFIERMVGSEFLGAYKHVYDKVVEVAPATSSHVVPPSRERA